MRYIVLALGLCFVSASLATPLEAAVKSKSHALKPYKNKVKPRKAPKPAKIRTRAN
jgi:hypothetical protein